MEKEALYQQFISLYPIDRLETLKLEEYTNLNKDSFCYWVENKLNDWGNIHGATSYKFGIFRWGAKPELEKTSVLADDKYAWQNRFGQTADEAYRNVRDKIVQIAKYAKEDEYEKIDLIDISEMFKWKIAFLYSNKKLINWFSKEALIKFAQYYGHDVNNKTQTSELQKILLNEKGERSLEEFNKELQPIWDKIQNGETNMLKAKELSLLLKSTNNLILHGAPGTGKTFLAKEIAKEMGCSGSEIGFVQFHPSYDYTDFVEGLRPVVGDNDKIEFEKKDGVFKAFCIKALATENSDNFDEAFDSMLNDILENGNVKELETPSKAKFRVSVNQRRNLTFFTGPDNRVGGSLTRKGVKTEFEGNPFYKYWLGYYQGVIKCLESEYQLHKERKQGKGSFVFIIDEINRGDLSKIFGELFYSIDPGYRIDVSNIKPDNPTSTILTQYSNMDIEPNDFDLVLGEKKQFGHFFVPDNVYIIGTMNDIDRSVESMDFAFRRRFTFKEIKAKDTQDAILSRLDESVRDEAIKKMDALNNAISEIEGLSTAYHIGAAYFLKVKDLDNDFDLLWEYHLEPLLLEYLRGQGDIKNKMDALKAAYNKE